MGIGKFLKEWKGVIIGSTALAVIASYPFVNSYISNDSIPQVELPSVSAPLPTSVPLPVVDSIDDAVDVSRQFVVYEHTDGQLGDSKICFTNLNKGPGGCLETELGVFGGDLSPDGKFLGVEGIVRDKSGYDVFIFDIFKNQYVQVTPANENETVIGWSGDYLYFISAQLADGIPPSEVYRTDAQGKNITQITDDGIDKFMANLSPDGTQIAYSFRTYERHGIRISDAETGELVKEVVSSPTGDFNQAYWDPIWSPDGKYVLARVNDFDNNERRLTIYDIETGAKTNIFTVPTEEPGISFDRNEHVWSAPNNNPNGSKGLIAFFGYEQLGYLTNRDLSFLISVGEIKTPAWSPNGNSLLWVIDDGRGNSIICQDFGNEGCEGYTLVPSVLDGRIRIIDISAGIK